MRRKEKKMKKKRRNVWRRGGRTKPPASDPDLVGLWY